MAKFRNLIGIFSAVVAVAAYGADPANPGAVAAQPEIRTEEDLAQGRINVFNVANELQNLFDSPLQLSDQSEQPRPVPPAVCRVLDDPDGNSTIVYRTRFTTSANLQKALDSIADKHTLVDEVSERNIVVLTTKSDRVEYYQKMIESLDMPAPQILIEAKIVEVLFNDSMQRNLSLAFSNRHINVNATTAIPGVSTPINGLGGQWDAFTGRNNLSVTFQWLKTAQDAKVLSSPNVMVTRNEVAKIVTGQDIPIQSSNNTSSSQTISTSFKRVGVSLEIEPEIISDDAVTLRIYPSVSNVIRYENITTGTGSAAATFPVPVISVRSVESHLRLYDQQVVIIGGLYDSRDTLQQERVPILSDLPLIGELFTGKNKTHEVVQLLFFIKIHIIPPERAGSDFIYDPAQQSKQTETLGRIIGSQTGIPSHSTSTMDLLHEMRNSLQQFEPAEK